MNLNDANLVADAIALAFRNHRRYTVERVGPDLAVDHIENDVRSFLREKSLEASAVVVAPVVEKVEPAPAILPERPRWPTAKLNPLPVNSTQASPVFVPPVVEDE